jgi:uncharacterized protein
VLWLVQAKAGKPSTSAIRFGAVMPAQARILRGFGCKHDRCGIAGRFGQLIGQWVVPRVPADGCREEAEELRRQHTWLKKLNRLAHFRLVIPLMRSPHPPEYTARGVMVGLFWAMTPLIGIQMALVFVSWLIARRKPGWDFSLLVSLAWTWVTNVFTLIPTYYLYYVTGKFLLGQHEAITGYERFAQAWHAALEAEGYILPLVTYAKAIAAGHGAPILVGSIPFCFTIAWLGYRWSLKFVIGLRKARSERKARRQRDKVTKLKSQDNAIEIEHADRA